MSVELNPIVKMWDPLGMTEMNIFDSYGGESATVGFLREAEVKHGRVAMAAFVGYIVHANHITFPAHVPGDYSSLAVRSGARWLAAQLCDPCVLTRLPPVPAAHARDVLRTHQYAGADLGRSSR